MAKITAIEKLKAVKRYLEGKEGQESIAKRIGVTKGILQTWIRQYQYHGKQDKVKIILELRPKYAIMALLQLAQIPRSSYYYVVNTLEKPDPDADVKAHIKAIYHEHKGRYGYRRIRDQLRHDGLQIK